jgi:hypothetical protein
MKKRKVSIYGRNLAISTIGACLVKNPAFQIEQIEDQSEIDENATPPDVILFDFKSAHAGLACTSLLERPTSVLIGVDLAKNRMLVLTGGPCPLLTIEDLVRAIEKNRFQNPQF